MALPHLLKYIYNNGTDEVIRRGKKIHANRQIELVDYDELLGNISFRVKDDAYSTYYKVHIQQFKDPKTLEVRCSCPYNLGEICRHESAALFQLQEMADKNQLNEEQLSYDQRHTVVKMKQLDLKMIKMLCATESYAEAEEFLRTQKAQILQAEDEKVAAELELQGITYRVYIQKNEERNLDTSCQCDSEHEHPLCVHKTIILTQLLNSFGPNYFDTIRNWDRDKNKLLAIYGYSLSDDLTGKFEFTYQNGRPFLRVLDPTIKRVITPASNEKRNNETAEIPPTPQQNTIEKPVFVPVPQRSQTSTRYKLAIVFSYNAHQYPFVQTDMVMGEANESLDDFVGKVERLDLAKFVNTEQLDEEDRNLLQQVRKLLPGEVSRYLNRNSPFSGIWENIVQQHDDTLPEETRHLIIEYLHPKFKKLFNELSLSNYVFYLPQGKTFTTAALEHQFCSHKYISPVFYLSYQEGVGYNLTVNVTLPDGEEVPLADNAVASPVVYKHKDQWYVWEKTEDVYLIERFLPGGNMLIDEANWPTQLQSFVLPLSRSHQLHFNNVPREEVTDTTPTIQLKLKERGDYLLFQPSFTYLGYEIQPNDKERVILPVQGKLLTIHRNMAVEKAFVQKMEALHTQFVRIDDKGSLALKGADVLKNNWFFLFIDAMNEQQIPVFGFDILKNFRFNTAKPSTKIYISSNTDWFDAKVDIHFGDQKVTVADIKKALANKQQFVPLQDGTLGILPEEWLKKYSLLFRVGDGKQEELKLSKYHFTVIDELYEQRNEEELIFKLEEKYERIREMHAIKEIAPPEHLSPILRPYQQSGFQWLNYLNEIQWGGILADDMGLGKTIQALTFLQHLRVEKGSLKALVVCPTTLMYNWENEIKKFTPKLTYRIHHGGTREASLISSKDVEVVITTYGTLRSDIKHFVEVKFDYVVLDESQAIKNPSSKVTKAASLLQAKNRLCLSGTPLQNNTFDIYAQMNFLNPGMLGSLEYFRQEFAVPIDKFGEKEQKEHLRRLLYPFILRRTKEQVAKDLPAKSEMVLFCEMGQEQRDIYDAFRNDFRDKILGAVDSQGIGKSQLTILQGLMKLRQICDSPAIMKDTEQYPNASVKLEELGREITENISNHKALVFSQFLGMLALIKERLNELGVAYEYFDGSTTPAERERAIQRFQNDESCRVFLISLKAGGVGLNLTAADYVYIVDPWWNPAVEQQAIDRTHRIGQTKNIFAYRMICKDTVEDKIIQLQERKKMLAADLITDDSGFVKSLSREDIEYLFS